MTASSAFIPWLDWSQPTSMMEKVMFAATDTSNMPDSRATISPSVRMPVIAMLEAIVRALSAVANVSGFHTENTMTSSMAT